MSVNLPSHYARQYADSVMLLLQQQGSRLRPYVTEGSYKGEQASPVDQVGSVEMQEVVSRFSPMPRVDADVDRRWIFPLSYDLPQLVDKNDELRMITDVKGKYVQNGVNAAGRRIDRTILLGTFGTNYTGKTGSTSTAFGSNSIAANFGAAGDVGATVAKLREGRRMLMAGNVDLETDSLHAAFSSTQMDNLLAEVQIISTDYNDRPVLVDGVIKRFLGFEFHQTEIVRETFNQSSGDAMCPLWAKSGLHLGIWEDQRTDISQRNDLQGIPWQVYQYLTIGACRLEEAKVVKMICNL